MVHKKLASRNGSSLPADIRPTTFSWRQVGKRIHLQPSTDLRVWPLYRELQACPSLHGDVTWDPDEWEFSIPVRRFRDFSIFAFQHGHRLSKEVRARRIDQEHCEVEVLEQ